MINRNKVHNKCNALELSWNQLTPRTTTASLWENCLPWNWSLVPKRLGTGAVGHSVRRGLKVRSVPACSPCVYLPLCFGATEGTSRDQLITPLCATLCYKISLTQIWFFPISSKGFPMCSVVKNLPLIVGEAGSIPGTGNGSPLQYSFLENPMDWGLQSMGLLKSQTWLSDQTTISSKNSSVTISPCLYIPHSSHQARRFSSPKCS